MIVGLIIILVLLLVLPFVFKKVEHNLEYFLFVMGISAALISKAMSLHLIEEILTNYLLYFITAAVLVAGLIFRVSVGKIKNLTNAMIEKTSLRFFVFVLILILGLVSSLITAIVASLILVEMIHILPLKHKNKVTLTVIACFSIGFGAALTPIGEPLATIVVSALDADFFYIFRLIGADIIIGVLVLAIIGAFYVDRINKKELLEKNNLDDEEEDILEEETEEIVEMEKLSEVFMRAFKIFIFVIALELLGKGFKPLIDMYIIHLDSNILYWVNTISAVLDNATIAAAEISPSMSELQIKSILLGLILSGGMLIPGNIPNIISAGKLQIKSKEWAKVGLPVGFGLLIIYFIVLNIFG